MGIGYEIFGHFRVADDIIKSIDELVTETAAKKVTVVLGAQKVKHCESSEFRKECSNYFKRYYKVLAIKAPLVLPSIIPTKLKRIVDTMYRWCNNREERHHVKGLILHSFFIKDLYSKLYQDGLVSLSQKLNIKDFPSKPSIIVYNTTERIFLLIRMVEVEDVEKEIILCGSELKILMIIIGDKLKNLGIKVIPLVVTDKESKCRECKSFLITSEEISHFHRFMEWLEQKSVDFDIAPSHHFEEDFSNEIFAKIVSCIGATKIDDIFPSFTTEEEKQMKGALLLLTPEQIDILHSEEKHIIIDGPYGSGKSIIGRTKAKMVADNLPKNDLLYYISYDSRSALLNEIQRNNPKIKIYPETEEQKGNKLSDMIKYILKGNKMERQHAEKSNESEKKINLIIDEYDGEKLDRSEADTLNSIINKEYKKIFQDAVIFLICQSMKKKRWTNDDYIDSNRFDLLEHMQKKRLTLVMRNSIQVYNLLEVTKRSLESVATRHNLKEKKKNLQEGKYAQNNEEKNTNNSEEVTSEEAFASDTVGDSAQFVGFNLELDEALDFAKSQEARDADTRNITSMFEYEEATDIGHRGESKLPVLLEICYCGNTFQKAYALTAAFECLQIRESTANFKHVLLHFNFNNEVTKLAFKLLDLKHKSNVLDKVTYSYEDFKNEGCNKYIFVANFCTFRGLEHSRITIIVDRDIYSLQHYLVECIGRCTTYLNIVLFGTNKTLNTITQKWKEGNKGNPLIRNWKIIASKDRQQSSKIWEIIRSPLNKLRTQFWDADTQKNEIITIDSSSQEYRKLEEIFSRTSFQKKEEKDIISMREAKIAIER